MKHVIARILAILALAGVSCGSPAAANPDTLAVARIIGIWQGTLKAPGMELRIVFHISQIGDTDLGGTMDSPDQGAKDILLSDVTIIGKDVHFGVKSIGGAFDGTLQDSAAMLVGQWKQGAAVLPMTLTHSETAPGLSRPQEPKPPYPYLEEDVSYFNPEGKDTLAGTLTLPKEGGPFTAVLLITGSGPQDRDEAVFGHKPFLLLADYLTQQGIAVLRVDDRGTGQSTGNFETATSLDFAADARAGISYLKSRKEINPKRIGLIGHSEGALISYMLAARNKDVSFVVSLSGPALPGAEIIRLQAAAIARAEGAPDSAIEKDRTLRDRMFEVVMHEADHGKAESELRSLIEEAIAGMPEEEKTAMGGSDSLVIAAQLKQLTSPWLKFFLAYDPRPDIRKMRCPVLAVMGDLDLQVPAAQNRPAMEAALKAAGNAHSKVAKFAGLNHLLQHAQKGVPEEYPKIEETMSPDVLITVADWIKER